MALFPSVVLESASRSLRFRHMAFIIPPLGGSRPGISPASFSSPRLFSVVVKLTLWGLAHNSLAVSNGILAEVAHRAPQPEVLLRRYHSLSCCPQGQGKAAVAEQHRQINADGFQPGLKRTRKLVCKSLF